MKHPVVHFEIMGHDAPALRSFYADVFGWSESVPGLQHGISGGIGKAPNGYDGHITFERRLSHDGPG